MKILKITLGILVVLSAVEFVYYFSLVNPIKSLISRDKSEVKKSISSVGDEVLIGNIVDYFRSKTIKPGVSYILEEQIDGYLTNVEIVEDKGRKYVDIEISSLPDNGDVLNKFGKNLETAGNLFFRLDENGKKQSLDPSEIKAGTRIKQITQISMPDPDPLNDKIEIELLD